MCGILLLIAHSKVFLSLLALQFYWESISERRAFVPANEESLQGLKDQQTTAYQMYLIQAGDFVVVI